MADAAQILRDNGMGLVDELIQGAQLEGVPLPIAATLTAGESWGKNIWGADGGMNVNTNGTYRPHTLVTQAAYLAYRTEMRAGRIIRQGCGPLQCTSAQYQDTADALGGCWVPLANYRSGFRGMGALMKRYGTRDGARRYNGSGPRAEAYADNFMKRLAIWTPRLAGASAPVPGPAPAPKPEEPDLDPNQARMLAEIHQKLTMKLPSRADYKLLGVSAPATPPTDDLFGMALNADARSFETRQLMLALLNSLPGMTDPNKAAQAVTAALRPAIAEAVREALGDIDVGKADAIVEAIGRRLIENG